MIYKQYRNLKIKIQNILTLYRTIEYCFVLKTHYKLLPHEIYKFENLPNYSSELQQKVLKTLGLENKNYL